MKLPAVFQAGVTSVINDHLIAALDIAVEKWEDAALDSQGKRDVHRRPENRGRTQVHPFDEALCPLPVIDAHHGGIPVRQPVLQELPPLSIRYRKKP